MGLREEMKMPAEFGAEVEDVLGPLMRRLGFEIDEVDDRQDDGGRDRHIVYYRSADCKVQVYQSAREGEVNCMIAPSGVPNQFGLNAQKWQHITRFSKRPDLPFKELLRAAREEYSSYPNPI